MDERQFAGKVSELCRELGDLGRGSCADEQVAADAGVSTAGDALRVINELRNRLYSQSSGEAIDPLLLAQWPDKYFDVSGEGFITALDALQIINRLGAENASTGGEGERVGTAVVLGDVMLSDRDRILSAKGSLIPIDAPLIWSQVIWSQVIWSQGHSQRDYLGEWITTDSVSEFISLKDRIWSDYGQESRFDGSRYLVEELFGWSADSEDDLRHMLFAEL